MQCDGKEKNIEGMNTLALYITQCVIIFIVAQGTNVIITLAVTNSVTKPTFGRVSTSNCCHIFHNFKEITWT